MAIEMRVCKYMCFENAKIRNHSLPAGRKFCFIIQNTDILRNVRYFYSNSMNFIRVVVLGGILNSLLYTNTQSYN